MLKRLICWVIIIFVLGSITYLDYSDKQIGERIPINIYTNVYGYEEDIKEHFEEQDKLKKQYKLLFKDEKNANTADVLLTSDFSKITKEKKYELLEYSPMVVMLKKNKQYTEKGLLSINKDDEAEIDFKMLIDAVINKKNWSYFGGEDIPIRVYCPEKDTIDGKLFYQLLLVNINDGKYPKTESDMKRCEKVANQFLESERVVQVEILPRVLKTRDIGNDIYVLPESDYYELLYDVCDEDISFVAYPTQTVIKEIYYQINTEVGQKFDEELKKESLLGVSLFYEITNYYRTMENPQTYREYTRNAYSSNAKTRFNYVELPKDFWNSVIAE